METQSLINQYGLPQTVQVKVTRDDDGSYFAQLTEHPGCMTIADSQYELILNLTDAILTYFEVPHEGVQKLSVVYFPQTPITETAELNLSSFHLLASQHSYGNSSTIRTT